MKQFREIHARDITSASLKEEMDAHGYVLIRELLPPDDLNRLLGEITQIAAAAGWLLPGHNPLERMADASAECGDDDPTFKALYKQVFGLESLHTFAHHPALQRAMHLLVGERLLVHPKPVARLIFPNNKRFVTHMHQDNRAIGGDTESFTAWMPMHDCPVEMGPLQVLEASHRYGLLTSNPTEYLKEEKLCGGDWVSGPINAGDVLLFHSLTVHAGTQNSSDQIRVSMDCRFQDYERALDPAALVFPGPSSNRRSWEAAYAGWRSDDLKYYWKKLPLKLRPSNTELAQLAETADSPEMRSRYARILEQIVQQMPD